MFLSLRFHLGTEQGHLQLDVGEVITRHIETLDLMIVGRDNETHVPRDPIRCDQARIDRAFDP